MAVTSQDFHTIGCVISVDPARKSLGYQGQSSRVNQDVLGSHEDLRCHRVYYNKHLHRVFLQLGNFTAIPLVQRVDRDSGCIKICLHRYEKSCHLPPAATASCKNVHACLKQTSYYKSTMACVNLRNPTAGDRCGMRLPACGRVTWNVTPPPRNPFLSSSGR